MRYLLLTGMSGAGKTLALRDLEDLGAFCVDNLPPSMIPGLIRSCESTGMTRPAAAFSVDVRSGALFDPIGIHRLIRDANQLEQPVEIIFLEAEDDALVSRFKETRREHPLCGDGVTLTEAIARERALLQPLRESADYLIDTTHLTSRALQKRLKAVFDECTGSEDEPMHAEVLSFGFKRGLPRQADLVFDVRFLPNPFYIPELCRHSGQDEDVRDFVMDHPTTQVFMQKIRDMLSFLLPHYQEEGKRRLVIAVGCTGGAHRSVAIAEAVAAHLREIGCVVQLEHRDLEVEQSRWNRVSEE